VLANQFGANAAMGILNGKGLFALVAHVIDGYVAGVYGPFVYVDDPILHLVKQVRRLSGVAFHLHQFRHTFAVNFLNRGGDVAKLKQLLGHRDIRMTSVYLRCLPTAAMRGDVENITLDTLL
jgi:integrase